MHGLARVDECQQYRNQNRVIRFFCARCRRVVHQVELLPLPACPVPLEVWKSLWRIPPGTAPLLAKPVDFDTLLAIVRRLVDGKSPGSDGFLQELYKYCLTSLITLLQTAINAFIAGQDPTVHPKEWLGALVALMPKSLAALLMTEFRPVAKQCAKFVISPRSLIAIFAAPLKSTSQWRRCKKASERTGAQRQITKLLCLIERS